MRLALLAMARLWNTVAQEGVEVARVVARPPVVRGVRLTLRAQAVPGPSPPEFETFRQPRGGWVVSLRPRGCEEAAVNPPPSPYQLAKKAVTN